MAGQEQLQRDVDKRLQVHESRGVEVALFAMRRTSRGRGWRSVLVASLLAVVALGAVLLRDSWLAHAGPSVYAQAVLTDTPTFYYRLDESSGTTMADSSGNAHNATYQSGITYGAAGALANETTDTAITPAGNAVGIFSAGTGEPTGAAARTLEGWVRTSSLNQQTLVSWGSGGSRQYSALMVNSDGSFGFVTQNDDLWFYGARPVNDGNWHLLDIAYDGNVTATAYLDGQLVGSKQWASAINTGQGALDIGLLSWCSCHPIGGSNSGLDEVAVYSSALSATQVGNHFTASGDTRPSTPGSVTASAGANQATVSWTASSATVPSSETAVQGYVVTAYAGTTAKNAIAVGGSATSATLSGLQGSTSYTFQVAAYNAFGYSAAGTSAAASPTGSTTTYASSVLADSPSVYYRLDDPTGNVAADSSGGGHVAYYNTQNAWGSDIPGASGALANDSDAATNFNSTCSYCGTNVPVVSGSSAGLPQGSAARTFEAWFKTGVTGAVLQVQGTPFQVVVSGMEQFRVDAPSTSLYFSTSYSVLDSQWHQVDAVYDGTGSVTMYLDGQSIGTQSGAGTAASATGLYVGPNYIGFLDEVAAYNAALTSTQVSNHFAASGDSRPGAPPSVSAAIGSNQVTVSWTASTAGAPAGAAAVTGYLVTAYAGSTPKNTVAVGGTTTSTIVYGLLGGTAYTFHVTPLNEFGLGTAAVSSAVTPPGTSSTYAATVLADGPSAYYRLDDPSGNVAADSSGGGHLAYYNTQDQWGSDKPASPGALPNDPDPATNFSSTCSYCGTSVPVINASGAGLPQGSSARTLEAWVKTTGTGNIATLSGGRFQLDVSGASQLRVYTPSATLFFTTAYPVTDGQWHLLDAVYDGTSSVTAYLDGQSLGTQTGAGTASSSTGLTMGMGPQSEGFIGFIDEMAVYNNSLTTTQVTSHFVASGIVRPTAPAFVTASFGGNNTVTVTWGVPGPRNVPIQNYLVRAFSGSNAANSVYVAGTQTTARINGLAAGTGYTFTVQATNYFGTGPTGTSHAFVPTAGGTQTYASAALADGAAPYYRFSEASGTPFADSSPTSAHGTYTGGNVATLNQPGAVGNGTSISLSGACCAAAVTTPTLPTGNASRSLDAWVKPADATFRVFASWGPTQATTRQLFAVGSSATQLGVATTNDDHYFTYPASIQDGLWHHLAVTYDGTTLTAYLDGQSLGTQTFAGALATSSATGFQIGYAQNFTGWKGSLAELAVYNRVLTAAQVSNHRQLGVCPAGWNCEDIGGSAPVGTQTLTSGAWTVQGGGYDIWNPGDQFRFVGQSLSTDGTISAHIASQTNTNAWAKAGIMLRASDDPLAAYYGVVVTPSNGIAVQYRSTQGGNSLSVAATGTVPTWFEVTRWTDNSGSSPVTYYTAYTSTNGTSWTVIPGSTMALSLPGTLLAGLADTSHNAGTLSTVVFDTVSITSNKVTPAGICPARLSCTDIGSPLPTGAQNIAGSTWSVSGGGSDIWSTSDQFHFVASTMTADGTVSAHIASQGNTNAWAKAGVMLRASTDPGAPYYGIVVTPSNGIQVQYRTTQGGGSTGIAVSGSAPTWLKVTRWTDNTGSTAIIYYSAYTSSNGTTWTVVPTSTMALNLTGTLLDGVAVTSHNSSSLSTVSLDNVSLTALEVQPAGICLAYVTCADIGGGTPTGTQNLTGSTWSVSGGGSDIWSTSDQFRYIYKSMSSDGTVSAQVFSQTNTNSWAKAGVMMRGSNAAGAPYYGILMTPSNGVSVQWRTTQGGASNQILLSGTAPLYLEVSRWTDNSGSSAITYYTALTSSNGTTWTVVSGSTVAMTMSSSFLVGTAVTSHDWTQLSTVVFKAVTTSATSSEPPGVCPANFTCADIGSPTPTGTQAQSGSSWSIQAGGSDIWDVADHFRFISQTLSGDGSVSAHLASVNSGANAWAKAGIMLRASSDPGAAYYGVFVTPSNGLVVQYRSAQGGTSTQQVQATGTTAPIYLKITRSGTTFSVATSSDGSSWTTLSGSSVTLSNLTGSLLAGMAVTSHDSSNLWTVVFDTVSM